MAWLAGTQVNLVVTRVARNAILILNKHCCRLLIPGNFSLNVLQFRAS